MARIAPPVLIAAPPPPMRPYGIFDVALGPMPMPATEAQGSGIQYVPDACEDDVYLYDIACPAVSGSKSYAAVESAISGSPFAVITSYTCGVIGFSFDEARQRVLTRMSLREQMAVERRIWQGSTGVSALGQIQGLLRGAADVTPGGSAVCIQDALSILEQRLANNGVLGGVIHMRPKLVPHMADAHLIERVGRQLRTTLGTPISVGYGYDGTGPAGEATSNTTDWMYASGRVLIWQDPEVWVSPPGQVLNKSTNQLSLVAERTYVAIIECGAWAVNVSHPCPV